MVSRGTTPAFCVYYMCKKSKFNRRRGGLKRQLIINSEKAGRGLKRQQCIINLPHVPIYGADEWMCGVQYLRLEHNEQWHKKEFFEGEGGRLGPEYERGTFNLHYLNSHGN